MPAFRFRLEKLLRLRQTWRDQRQLMLAEALRAETALQQQRQGCLERLDELASQARGAAGPGPVDLDRMMQAQRYQAILRAEGELLERQSAMLREEIERRRQALVAADCDVRVLEKLRQRQADRHRQTEHKLEIKNLDQLVAWQWRGHHGGPTATSQPQR